MAYPMGEADKGALRLDFDRRLLLQFRGSTREADQDRREGGEPWALRHLPAGRGRGAATDVRRSPVADRAAAGTARAGMTGVKNNAACKRR